MPFTKKPLRQLVERDLPNQNGFGWEDFEKIAQLEPQKRPSVRSIARMYNKSYITIKKWLDRFDEETK